MSDYFNAGDIFINTLTITSTRGELDLVRDFVTADVYESIFTPGIVATIQVLDMNDYLGTLKLSGDEIVVFSFNPPGGQEASYTFALNSIEENTSAGAMKAKMYTLNCVSQEALAARANHVTKHYKTQHSNMIEDIFKTFIGSTKKIFTEGTTGVQKHIVNTLKPFAAIDQIRRRSVSSSNKSSAFLFFENQDGYNFKTMEALFDDGPVKNYKQEDTVGSQQFPDMLNQILAYKLKEQGGTTDKIDAGALKSQFNKFDFRTHSYTTQKIEPGEQGKMGGTGNMISSTLKAIYGSTPGQILSHPYDSRVPDTKIPETSPLQEAYASSMGQIQLNLTVMGDTVLKAGKTVNCTIPKKVAITGNAGNEVLVNGTFLLSRVRHQIRSADKRPRYIAQLECISGKYDNGVS